MKNILFIPFLLIVINFKCFGQESVRLFLNENFEETDSLTAKYIREANIINGRYFITDLTIKGAIIHYGEYKSVNPWIEDGLSKNYLKPDQIYSSGKFNDGKMTGVWIYYLSDLTTDTVTYDLGLIESLTGECGSPEGILRFNRKETLEIQTIVYSLSQFFEQNLHLPARTRKNTLAFSANISFVLQNDGKITCLAVKGINDDDLILEIQRVVSKFNYVKESKKPFIIDFELNYNENKYANPATLMKEADNGIITDVVYTIVEKDPAFKGRDFFRYIEENIQYPEQAVKYGIQGSVMLNLIVEKDGTLSNVRVLRGVDPVLDKEAIRVIESSPKWEPGRQRGEPVRVSVNLPVVFKINK
jgi:TonB family protein